MSSSNGISSRQISNWGADLVHRDASSAAYMFFLKAFFALWFVRYVFDPLQDLSGLPLSYSAPIGWMTLLPSVVYEGIHSYPGLLLLKTGVLAACIGVWFGRARVISALCGCVLLTTACAISRGFGHINHAEIGPLLVTWVLTLFLLRIPRDLVRQPNHEIDSTSSAGLVCATLVLTLVYAFVGVNRLVSGGLQVFAGETMTNHMIRATHYDWIIAYDTSSLVLASAWLILVVKLGTVAVTFMEIASPFCLIHRRLRLLMLLIMPGFHLGAILLFKVIFIEQPLSLILLFNVTPWLANRKRCQVCQVPFWTTRQFLSRWRGKRKGN